MTLGLQDRHALRNARSGCGPANEKGLRIKSFVQGDVVVAEWRAERHHEAFSRRAPWRHHGCLARLPQQLAGCVALDDEEGRHDDAVHGDGWIPREAEAPDAD